MVDSSEPKVHRQRGAHRVVSVAGIGLAVVALVAVGVLVGALVVPARVPASVAPAAVASTVQVSTQSYDGAHQVVVNPQIAVGTSLKSAATGVVTASKCAVGKTLASGQALVSVNGEPVIGLATATPLWRDLAYGDDGSDVSALQKELARLGQSVDVTGTYGSATRSAVEAVIAAAGGSSEYGDLALSSVVWLPSKSVAVSACAVTVGDQVASGQEVAQVGGGLVSLTVPNPPGDGWVVAYGDKTATMDNNGLVTDAAFLAAVAAGPEYQYFAANQSQGGSLQLTVRLKDTLTVLVVPPSAVVVAGPGKGCVVSDGATVPVTIVSSLLGQTLVSVDGTPPTTVALQPGAAQC